jgi:polyribonucleotide nucleotidyltransferase
MAHHRVDKVTDVMKEGDPVEVKVISVDRDGKIRLTRRELLPLPEGDEGARAAERIKQAREAGGPPPRSGGGRDRRDGPRDRGRR